MRCRGLICLALVAFAPWAQAQSRITPEEFLSRALGKTLDFHDARGGRLVGREYFISPGETIWQPVGAACERGELTTPDGKLCFRYASRAGRLICWVPFEFEGRLFVREAQIVNAETQEVRRVTDDVLSCDIAPMS